MKVDDLMDAIGKIDAEYVAEAEETYVGKKPVWKRKAFVKVGAPLVAGFVLLVVGGVWLQQSAILQQISNADEMQEGSMESAIEGDIDSSVVENATLTDEAVVEDEMTSCFYKNDWADVAMNEDETQKNEETFLAPDKDVADQTGMMVQEGSSVSNLQEAAGDEETDVIDLTSEALKFMEDRFTEQEITKGDDSITYRYGREEDEASTVITFSEEVISRFGDLFKQEELQVSQWNNYEVVFLQLDGEEHYLAQYQTGDTFVEVETQNVSEDEFLEILKTLLN